VITASGRAVARTAGLRTARLVALVLIAAVLSSCSREKIDWKSAESADTVESYDHFLARHPDGELATQARARVAQLNEDRDWKRANAADTAEAYRQFLAQHDSGKWSEEARIRVENFALDGTAAGPSGPVEPAPAVATAPANSPASARPAQVATAEAPKPVVSSPAPKNAIEVPQPTAVAKPNTAPAGTSAAAASPVSQFGVQLGAFRTQEAALADWKRLQAKFNADLHGLSARPVPVHQTAGQLFRLQAPVGEERRARAICASLAKQSQPCVVVLPASH
jgi:cell division septation protein DedD